MRLFVDQLVGCGRAGGAAAHDRLRRRPARRVAATSRRVGRVVQASRLVPPRNAVVRAAALLRA